MNLTVARGVDECHILIVPSTSSDVAAQQPAAVWTPLKPQVAVTIREIILAVHHRTYLLGGKIDDTQLATVLEESHFLPVRAELGLQRCHIGIRQPFLLQFRAIGEQFLVCLLEFRAVNLPVSTTLGTIHDALPVGCEVDATLLLGCISHLLGGLIIHGCHKHVSMHHECHLFSTWRKTDLCGAVAPHLTNQLAVVAVSGDADLYLLWLTSRLQGVDFPVVTVAKHSVTRHAQVADWILLMLGELLFPASVDIPAVHIEGAVLLAQIIVRGIISPARGTVLTFETAQLGILTALTQPDVAANGRLVVLAEGILVSFPVVIKHVAPAVDTHIFHHQRGEKARAPALDTHLVHLIGAPSGKDIRLRRGHECCGEEHMRFVAERHRHLVAAMSRQPDGTSSGGIHHIDIETSLTRGGKSQFLSVRTPHGIGVVSGI